MPALNGSALVSSTPRLTDEVSLHYPIATLPMRFLVSDLFHWSYFYQRFQDSAQGFTRSRLYQPAEVYRLLHDHKRVISWTSDILHFMTPTIQDSPQALTDYGISIHATGDILARYVLSCAYLKIPAFGHQGCIPIWKLGPKDFRRYLLRQLHQARQVSIPHSLPKGHRPPAI